MLFLGRYSRGGWWRYAFFIGLCLISAVSPSAYSQVAPPPAPPAGRPVIVPTKLPDKGVIDGFIDSYKNAAKSWQAVIGRTALRLFYVLSVIDFCLFLIKLLFSGNANFQAFVVGLTKWLLRNTMFYLVLAYGVGAISTDTAYIDWQQKIVDSFRDTANRALGSSGVAYDITPSSYFDAVIEVIAFTIVKVSWYDYVPVGLALIVITIASAISLATYILTLIETTIAIYAGSIMLAFAGLGATRSYATGYIRYIISVGFKLFLMLFTMGAGLSVMLNYLNYYTTNEPGVKELFLLALLSVIQTVLLSRVPSMVQGIISGVDSSSADSGLQQVASTTSAVARTAQSVASTASSAVSSTKNAARTAVGASQAFRSSWRAEGRSMQAKADNARVDRPGGLKGLSQQAGGALQRLVAEGRRDVAERSRGTRTHHGTLGGRIANNIDNPKK